MFHVPESYRLRTGQMGTDQSYGNNGVFAFTIKGVRLVCVVSDGLNWEHVSVEVMANRTPTWIEMCMVKNLFWDEEDCVVQFHPPKSEYVNCHPFVLHLWRKTNQNMETPLKSLV